MTVSQAAAKLASRLYSLPWGKWARQIQALLRLEIRKTLFGRRSIPVYLLAMIPLPVFLILAAFPLPGWDDQGPQASAVTYAWIYQTFILRAVLFFGCVAIFTNLIRGEVQDRSLHYFFLAPLRREVLVVGKFTAGFLMTSFLFCGITLITYLLLLVPFGPEASLQYFFQGPGLGHLLAYLGVSLLACLGYGAVFLTFGLLFRNPILPAGAVLVWELMNFLLPPFLKRISVIYYIKGLCPVPLSEGPFAVLTQPPPAWLSILGLLLFSIAVLVVGGLRVRRMEIHYAQD